MKADTTARDAKARNLCARLSSDRRTETELDVIDLLLSGIESHEEEYGGCHADTDRRDCLDERDQEMQDGLFYHLLEAVKRRAARRRRVTAFCNAFDDDQPTREFPRAGTSEQPSLDASFSAAPPSVSPSVPHADEGAAPFLELEVGPDRVRIGEADALSAVPVSPDFDCDECGQRRGTHHLNGCGYSVVVLPPVESEVA